MRICIAFLVWCQVLVTARADAETATIEESDVSNNETAATTLFPTPSSSVSSAPTICVDNPIGWSVEKFDCISLMNDDGIGCDFLAEYVADENGIKGTDACCACGGGGFRAETFAPTMAPVFVAETERRALEREALELLYVMPLPTEWIGIDHCHWFNSDNAWQDFLQCDNDGHVTHLRFNRSYFRHAFPTEIGQLKSLQELDLDRKLFFGFPTEIGMLSELVLLSLRSNTLGSIPSEIGDLYKLESIDFKGASLTGKIPSQIGQLTKLKVLRSGTNAISELPTEIGKMRSLEMLDLSFCQIDEMPTQIGLLENLVDLSFSGGIISNLPTEMGMLQNLTYFNIDSNSLVGTIPTEFGMLTKMRTLVFDNNNLSGTLPQEIFMLDSLQSIYAANNELTGSIPSQINALSMLNLFLGSNKLTGNIPSGIGVMRWLEKMSLYRNLLTGTIPSELALLESLISLSIHSNALEGNLPQNIGKWVNMKTMNLANNQLTGPIPSMISNLLAMENFSLQNNRLEGSIPYEICELKSLNTFSLQNNRLTSSIPACIGNITTLSKILLGNNELTGTLPMSLGDVDRLDELRLNGNALTGNLTASIFQSFRLEVLDLSDNMLQGTLPTEISELDNLKELKLSENGLSGNIPSEIGQLLKLQSIDLSRNKLSDRIPATIGQLENLESLYLQENHLNSYLPYKFADKLSVVNISSNALTGTIGSDWSFPFSTALTELDLSHNQFRGLLSTQIGSLIELRSINLGSNQLIGRMDIDFSGLGKLIKMDFSHNSLNGFIPESIDNLARLQQLKLQNNQFEGQLPLGIGRLTQLREVNISNNRYVVSVYDQDAYVYELEGIDGQLPIEWGQLAVIETLDLSGNRLDGVVPDSFANLERLRSLYLHDNMLSGKVPFRLGHLEKLQNLTLSTNNWGAGQVFSLSICGLGSRTDLSKDKISCPPERNILKYFYEVTNGNDWAAKEGWLDEYKNPCSTPTWYGLSCDNSSSVIGIRLEGNGLFGTFPADIFSLQKLQEFNVADNNLFGTIPDLGEVGSNLKVLNIAGNQLSGSLPSSLSNFTILQELLMHENRFTGTFMNDNLKTITADCGIPYFHGVFICENCEMCCNSLGVCNPKLTEFRALFDNERMILWLAPVLGTFVVAIAVFVCSVFIKNTPSRSQAHILCGEHSVYLLVLVRGYVAPLPVLLCVAIQINTYGIFLESSRSEGDNSDVEYTWRCPVTQPWCDDENGTTRWGWFIFALVMLVALAKDLINGVKLFYLAFRCKNNRYFAGGFILILVTLMSMWASYKYNRAIATKNTELLMNSVVLLFVQEIDDWVFQLLDGAFPSWTNAKLAEANALSESTLSVSVHWGSNAGTSSVLPLESENDESKAKKDITNTYWENSIVGQGSSSSPTESQGSQGGKNIKERGTRKAKKEIFKDALNPDDVELSISISEDDGLSSKSIVSENSLPNVHQLSHTGGSRSYPPQVSFNLDTGSVGEPDRNP